MMHQQGYLRHLHPNEFSFLHNESKHLLVICYPINTNSVLLCSSFKHYVQDLQD